jgi:hypothetical protein
MLCQRITTILIFGIIATMFLAGNVKAVNDWPESELGDLQPIGGERYGAPVLTTPYPGMATNIKLSEELATEGLNLYIPIIEDKNGNLVIPVIREAHWKTYIPLFNMGEPVELPKGQPKITLPVSEQDGILHIPLSQDIGKHQTLNMPALQYPEHGESAFVVPLYSTETYDHVIPLIREINTKHNTHTFDPWPVEHNPLFALEY